MENIILTNNKDLRLVGVKVGVLSTLRFELPLVSASATHVEVIVTSGNVHSAYTATFIDATKRWQCDIAASQFPTVGKQSYEVAYVLDGKQFWDGKGWIEIENATTSGIEPQPRPEPYRYAVVSVNGYGADAQGAVRIPKTFITTDSPATTEGYIEGDICFNRETGAMWTLCNVQGTPTWVFAYKNYYTKAETEEAIDRVAAYYITYDAAGNPFPTYAALANATTVYSGGAVRVPTRNDYAIVLADETHDGAEWRYIYAVADGQTTGQWEAQYPVEGVITFDNTVTKDSTNGVKSSGIWSAIWGALTALPTGFSSLYDWCVSQLAGKMPSNATGADIPVDATQGAQKINAALAGKASTADATLTPVYGGNGEKYSSWAIDNQSIVLELESGNWVPYYYDGDTHTMYGVPKGDVDSTTLSWTQGVDASATFTATRTENPIIGYQLGSQSGKPLASEAEAVALRQGKQDALTQNQLANIAAVPDKLDKSGGTMTGPLTMDKSVIELKDQTGYKCVLRCTGTGGDFYIDSYDSQGTLLHSLFVPVSNGSVALTAGFGHAGNLAALDTSGNPTDAGWTAGDIARYALTTKTINNGAVTLDDRAINAVAVSSSLASLTINFPTATSGKVRDFAMRLYIAAGVTAPELAWPQGVTLENNDGEVPEIADGGTGGSSTILYFSETKNNGTTAKFLVKGETLTAITQA